MSIAEEAMSNNKGIRTRNKEIMSIAEEAKSNNKGIRTRNKEIMSIAEEAKSNNKGIRTRNKEKEWEERAEIKGEKGALHLLKNAVFWGMTPCEPCKNRRFGGTYRLHHQGVKNQLGRKNVSSN
jgi:hypothetical protein